MIAFGTFMYLWNACELYSYYVIFNGVYNGVYYTYKTYKVTKNITKYIFPKKNIPWANCQDNKKILLENEWLLVSEDGITDIFDKELNVVDNTFSNKDDWLIVDNDTWLIIEKKL
tara:strand:- start:182 stop:526 length:345 start_codon:yes stop_codon:yes gene_type:complete